MNSSEVQGAEPVESDVPPAVHAAAAPRMTREEIVHRAVIEVRSADHKSRLRSDQCRALRTSAEKLADRIEKYDGVVQQVVIGMTARRGGLPDGAMLDSFIDEARLVASTLREPLGPWTDTYGRDQGERPARMMELVRDLMVRSRVQMDPKTRMVSSGCRSLRDKCLRVAEAILDLDVQVQDVVVAFCARAGLADGSQLQTYVDQSRLVVDALRETFPPPMPPPQHA